MNAKKAILGVLAAATAWGLGFYLTRQEPVGAEETPTEAPVSAVPEVKVGII